MKTWRPNPISEVTRATGASPAFDRLAPGASKHPVVAGQLAGGKKVRGMKISSQVKRIDVGAASRCLITITVMAATCLPSVVVSARQSGAPGSPAGSAGQSGTGQSVGGRGAGQSGGLSTVGQGTGQTPNAGAPATQTPAAGRATGTPGQSGQPGGENAPGQAPAVTTVRTQSPPGAARVTTPGPSQLSLEQAIQLAIQNNLATLLARERQREARGLAREALSSLLPNLSGTSFQANRTVNLRAQGISFPGVPTLVGPFNSFDARLELVQTIFNLSAIRSYQAGRIGVDIAKSQEQLARQQVATFTTLAYLDVLRTRQRVEDVRANLDLARSLLTLAEDQRNAGVATGVDVARASTRVSEQTFNLAEARTQAVQAVLQLQRVVGLPQGAALALTDPLRFTTESAPSVEAALATASQNRYELRVAEQQVQQRGYERKAAKDAQLPSLDFAGDYGESGVRPYEKSLPTRSYAVRLNVPVFNGGLTRARIAVATSQQREAELQLSDTRGQVEQDVRLALTTLETTAEQVQAAQATLQLAERELQLSRDRFRAGVADNIEVLNAQTALANARDSVVTALAAYNAARVNLAAALGRAEAFRF